MESTYELKLKKTNLKSKILSCLSLSLMISIICAIIIFFEEKSNYFSLIAFSISFIIVFSILFFMYQKGQITNSQLNELHEDFNVLIELKYHINDLKIKPIMIMKIVFPLTTLIFCVLLLMFKEYLAFVFSFSLLIVYGIIYFLEFFKLKIECKITDKGIIIGSIISKSTILRWQDIVSYELKDDMVQLNLAKIQANPRFPTLNQKEKILRILDKYINKN